MARKDTLVYKVATAQSLSASFQSPATVVKQLDNCSYQINVNTTDSTGTFSVQGSDDYAVSEPTNVVTNVGHWIDLPLGGTPVSSAAVDQILINLNQIPFYALRVTYTSSTAGTGTCDIIMVAKQLGG